MLCLSEEGGGNSLLRDFGGAAIMLIFFRISAYLTDKRMLRNRGKSYRAVMDEVSPLVPFPTWLP